MKIIIDIPEEEILMLQAAKASGDDSYLHNVILNGKPIPETSDNETKVLEDIKAEIQYEADNNADVNSMSAYYHCLQIIDKHTQN